MLTETGYDKALDIVGIPSLKKYSLSIKSYEAEKIVKKIKEKEKPKDYNPVSTKKRKGQTTKITSLRNRGFRQAVIEAYTAFS